ncbi:MAG: FHA domain-containing protein [Chthonomonas sp.]|nr:FHA domain-containing protein [Chthonomonas sp.]
MKATITVKRNGEETSEIFELNPPSVIGRFDPAVGPIDVDLGPLPEGAYVSRKHAKITFEDGVWTLVDMGSSNGTFVLRDDFEKVEESALENETEFALGNARFVFRISEEAELPNDAVDEEAPETQEA